MTIVVAVPDSVLLMPLVGGDLPLTGDLLLPRLIVNVRQVFG